nr:reverse transcriptase domain-containing protein [Tanacetum cinerariifolium]
MRNKDTATWDGGKGTWGGRERGMGTVWVVTAVQEVYPYGTVELSQPDGPNFKVNGHRLKHYLERTYQNWDNIAVLGSKGDNISVLDGKRDHDIGTWNMAIVYCIMREWSILSGRKSVPGIVAVNREN